MERLELSTNGLKGRCSTVELHARDRKFYHAPPLESTDFEVVFKAVVFGRSKIEICNILFSI